MKKLPLLFTSFIIAFNAAACTTFCIEKDGQIVFGRNYDWVTGAGIVHTNQRGLFKTSSGGENKISWVSQYGSITFNQYGKEFPTGGMNEKGLVVELMWLDGTRYPKGDSRPAVTELTWVQYQLDNCSSIEEIISTDKKLRITQDGTPLHFLVADAQGKTASIEFLEGKMVVHKDADLPFPTLTNNTYHESVQSANKYLHTGNLPGDNSLDRFITSCRMIEKLTSENINQPLTDYAFSILDKVSQGDYTKWSIVYDISNKKITFKTQEQHVLKTVALADFDFACNVAPKMYEMNQPGAGNIASMFTEPDAAVKKAVLDKAVKESSSQVVISKEDKKTLLDYEKTVKCKE